MYKFLKSIALVSIILLQVIQANAATLTVGTGSGYQVISGNGAAKPSVAVNDDGSWNVCWLEGTNYYCKGYNSSDQATIQKTLVGDVGSIPNTASALLYGNIKTVSLPTTGEFFVAYNTTLSSGVFTYELKRFTKAGTQIPIDTVGTVMSITGNQTSNATWNQFSGNSRYLVSMFLSWDGYLTITDSVLVSADGWNTGYHVYRVAGGNFTAISGVNGTGVYGWTGTDPYIYVPRMWCRHPSGYGPDNVSCALVAYNNTGYGAVGLTNVTYVYGWDATTVANWFGNRTSLGTSGGFSPFDVGMAGPNPASNSSMDDSLLTLVTRYSNCTQEFRYMDGNIYNPASAPFISTYLTDGSASTACSSTFNGTYPTPKTLAIKSLINGGVVAVVGWAGYKLPDSSLPFANLSQGLQVFYWDGYNNTAPVLVTPDILTQPNIEVSDIAISRNGKVVVVR